MSLRTLQIFFRWIARVLILLAIVSRFFSLSTDPEQNDGRKMVEMALKANQEGHLASEGMLSTRGRPHGPVSIWVLQLGFLFTDNEVDLRAPLCLLHTLLTLLGVIVLARALTGLCTWEEVATIFLIPDVWYYSRHIWDNPLLIPLSLIAVSSYVGFCRSLNARWLPLTAFTTALMFGTHLLSLSCVLALAVHFLIYHRNLIRKNVWLGPVLLLCFLSPLFPYLNLLFQPRPFPQPIGQATLFSFAWEQLNQGFKAISIGALPFGLGWRNSPLAMLFHIGEGLAYAFGIAGIFWSARKRKIQFPNSSDFISQLHTLCLLIIFCAVGIQLLGRVEPLLHYYHGCWMGYLLALFLGWIRGNKSKLMEIAKIAFICFNAWGIRLFVPI